MRFTRGLVSVSIIGLLVLSLAAKATEPFTVSVLHLFPTQKNVGLLEVQRKTEKLQSKSPKKAQLFLEKNPVPVVRGPDGGLYMIDHHHLALAASAAGYDQVYVQIVEDLGDLTPAAFWKEMKSRNYVYLKDENGATITPEELPGNLKDMGDDPYRSLAGKVRRRGGFVKSKKPFGEFAWAQYFRERIQISSNSKTEFKQAIEEAMKIVHAPEASKLPGYTPHDLEPDDTDMDDPQDNDAPSCEVIF